MALGGFLGFGCSFLSALGTGGDDMSGSLLRASVGMIVGAGLMKILISLAHSAFRDAQKEKMKNIPKAEPQESPPPAEPIHTAHAKHKP